MSIPSFSEATALIAVIEQKSFAEAAKQLGLSRTRVSELVRNVEDRLRVRLVDRTTRSVAPTTAGERLFNRLRPVLDEYRAAFESTNEFRSKPAGTVRLAVSPTATDTILVPLIPRFLGLYPEINLDILSSPEGTDIVAGRFDAGIHSGERLARDMIALRISDEVPTVIVAAPVYLAQHGAPKTPSELTDHDCLCMYKPNGELFSWQFREKNRTFEVQVESRLVTNRAITLLKAAIEGAGLLRAPLTYVASEVAAGKLVTVLDNWPAPLTEAFFLYYPSHRYTRPALKVLVDFLCDAYRNASATRAEG